MTSVSEFLIAALIIPAEARRCFPACRAARRRLAHAAFLPRTDPQRSPATGAARLQCRDPDRRDLWNLGVRYRWRAVGEVSLATFEAKHGPLPGNAHRPHRQWPSSLVQIQRPDPVDRRPDRAWHRYQRGQRLCAHAAINSSIRAPLQIYSYDKLADAPAWLEHLAAQKKVSERALENITRHGKNFFRPTDKPNAYGEAALSAEIEPLAGAARGTRNDALNRAAFRLFQLAGGGELDGDRVSERLIEASHRNGLIKDDSLAQCWQLFKAAPALV